MQDYKSLCVAVMICATLVNIQTERHTHMHTDSTVTCLSLRDKFDQLSKKLVNKWTKITEKYIHILIK